MQQLNLPVRPRHRRPTGRARQSECTVTLQTSYLQGSLLYTWWDKSHRKWRLLDTKIACFLIYVKLTKIFVNHHMYVIVYTCIYRHELKSHTNNFMAFIRESCGREEQDDSTLNGHHKNQWYKVLYFIPRYPLALLGKKHNGLCVPSVLMESRSSGTCRLQAEGF